jgi:amidase
MNLKFFVILIAVALAAMLVLAACGQSKDKFPLPEPNYNAKLPRDFAPFEEAMGTLTDERRAELDEFLSAATILEIQARFDDGSLTSEELTVYYLDRIKRYDVDNFNSALALNPKALEEAKAMDAERADGQTRGMMHGIPILLKDNIAIQGMPTAAGAYAMKDWTPDRDATVTAGLRESGAVILGKANLSEWANWMDPSMPSGFSALGGQTRNPYGPYEVWGSSSGSAVAAAANFAVVTVGSETQGSLLAPASINSVVGLKPTHALVSGDYIIPLMPFQDNAGPMARNVTNEAILLTALVSPDPNDPEAAAKAGENYLDYLTADSLSGLRVGMTGPDDALQAVLEKMGAQVVMIDGKDTPGADREVSQLLPPVFKYAIDDFLPTIDAPVKSLEEIISFNKEDMANRAPYGQGYLEKSQNTKLSKEETAQKVDKRIQTHSDILTTLFDKYDVDVIFDNADQGGAPLFQAYAPAGWPAMVIPAGYSDEGEPISFSFVARPYEEGKMLAVAFAIEQATEAYRAPDLEATIQMLDEKLGDKK